MKPEFSNDSKAKADKSVDERKALIKASYCANESGATNFKFIERDGTTLADEPDGWSECYITGFVKRQILSTPDFPKPIARRSSLIHKIVDVPGKGLSIFATQDLRPGDLVFAERPIMVLSAATPLALDIPKHFSAEQSTQMLRSELEKRILEPLFARVPPEFQKAYLQLHNSHLSDGSGPLLGIARTNGFALGLRDKGKPNETTYSGIVKDGSRFNHSCMPNVAQIYMPSFSIQFRAACYVKAGEELTVSYCSLIAPAAERQKKLEPYGFQCTCAACQNPTVSDPRRSMYRRSMPKLADVAMWIIKPRAPTDLLNRLLDQFHICEKENLYNEYCVTQAYLDLIVLMYTFMADEENTVKYGRLLGQQVLVCTGDDTKLKELSRIEYHRKQPSWGYKKHPMGPIPIMRMEYFAKFFGFDTTDSSQGPCRSFWSIINHCSSALY